MPPNHVKGIAAFTPFTVWMRWRSAIGNRNASDTEWRLIKREGLLSWLPRSSSVRIVARLTIRNSETTRLDKVSRVRRLLRRTFFKMSFANFIRSSTCKKAGKLVFWKRYAERQHQVPRRLVERRRPKSTFCHEFHQRAVVYFGEISRRR